MATCLFTILTYIKWLWIKVNVNYKLKETIKIWTGYHSRIFTTKNKTILPQQPAIADQLSLHVLRTLDNSVCYIKSWLQFIYAGICRRLSLACYLYFLLKWDLRGCVVSLCHVTFFSLPVAYLVTDKRCCCFFTRTHKLYKLILCVLNFNVDAWKQF